MYMYICVCVYMYICPQCTTIHLRYNGPKKNENKKHRGVVATYVTSSIKTDNKPPAACNSATIHLPGNDKDFASVLRYSEK